MPFSRCITLAPVALVMGLDFAFTLIGQPDRYWQDYSHCMERNPIGEVFLAVSPTYFALVFCVWMFLILFLGLRLPKPFNIFVITGAFLGHVWGSASWLPTLCVAHLQLEVSHECLYGGYGVVVTAITCFCVAGNRPSFFRKRMAA